MGKKGKRKIGLCAYCGQIEPLSNDHIPPKCLFGEPLPNNLITVPCCDNCKHGTSKDDQYFYEMLSFRADTFNHPDVIKNWPKIKQSLVRQEARKMKEALLRTISEIELTTLAGIYLGQAGTYFVEYPRINKVIERITKGLFYIKQKRCLPNDYTITSLPLEGCYRLNEKQLLFICQLIKFASIGVLRTIGSDEVFAYKIRFLEDDVNACVALMRFFKRVDFIVASAPI